MLRKRDKKKLLLLGLFILFLNLKASDSLVDLIKQKKWDELAPLFQDDSHMALRDHFENFSSLDLQPASGNGLSYQVRFPTHGEIGIVTYEIAENKIRHAQIAVQIHRLFFIDRFDKYPVENKVLQIADAEIQLKRGFIYAAHPNPVPWLFAGEWSIRILPTDEEERLTLKRMFEKEVFETRNSAGLFILTESPPLEGLSAITQVPVPDNEDARFLWESYRDQYGFQAEPWNDDWYFPFSETLNLIIFKSKKNTFRCINDSSQSPDTQLENITEKKLLLSYNAFKGIKLSFHSEEELNQMELGIYFNPKKKFISGTSKLQFAAPSTLKKITLAQDLQVIACRNQNGQNIPPYRIEDSYYLIGEGLKEISLYFKGTVESSEDESEGLVILPQFLLNTDAPDRFQLLSREQNFYPNTGCHFFQSILTISIPSKYNCLASGTLIDTKVNPESKTFTFKGEKTKGISFVCGEFEKVKQVPATIPINVYASNKINISHHFEAKEISDIFDFLLARYGNLGIDVLNILFRRWNYYGGISNTGFIIFNLASPTSTAFDNPFLKIQMKSPVFLNDLQKDNLVHELAHQWWGGLISWKSYTDVWITEGLAQFSALHYLEKTLPEDKYQGIIEQIKKWIFKKKDNGPIIYGKRIANLSEDYHAYQAIVYGKSALVFMMLKDILGEDEFFSRLRAILEKFRFKSINSSQFIAQVTNNDPRLQRFFQNWIYSRKIPEISHTVELTATGAEVVVTQKGNDFVFPLEVEFKTKTGRMRQTIVIENQRQDVKIDMGQAIDSAILQARHSPVKLK